MNNSAPASVLVEDIPLERGVARLLTLDRPEQRNPLDKLAAQGAGPRRLWVGHQDTD